MTTRNTKNKTRARPMTLAGFAAASLLAAACYDEDPYVGEIEGAEEGTVIGEAERRPGEAMPGAGLDADLPEPNDVPDRRALAQDGPMDREPRAARAGFGGADAMDGEPVQIEVRTLTGGEVRVGETFAYTIVVENSSDHPVLGVEVTNMLPQDFELVSSTPRREGAWQNMRGSSNRGQPISASFQRESWEQGQRGQQGQDRNQQPGSNAQGAQEDDQDPDQESNRATTASGAQDAEGQPDWRSGQGSQAAGQGSPSEIRWRVGKLEPGESQEIQVRGVANAEGQLSSCVSVSYDSAVCVDFAAVAPELVLERVVPTEPVYVCDEIPILYRLSNEGSGATGTVEIREELPEGFATAEGERVVSIRVASVGAGETIEQEARVNASRAGELSGRATATSDTLEVQSNRGAVRILDPSISLDVQAPRMQYVGRDVTFTVAVENTSDDPARDVVVRWQRPENGQRFSVSRGDLQAEGDAFMLGDLMPGERRSFDIAFEAVEPGAIQSTFVAEAYCADAQEQTAEVQLEGIEAVRLETIDLTDPVAVGETTTYEVRVKNQGTAASINVDVTAELPEAFEFVSADGSTEVSAEGRTLSFGRIAELPPDEVAVWRIDARASSAAKARFRVELKTEATKRSVTEVEPTTAY